MIAVGIMVNDPEALTVCGPDIPEPATGDGVIVTVDAFVEVHCKVVALPSSMSDGLAPKVAVGTGVVFTVNCLVRVSTPEQPVREILSVNVVVELTVKLRVPLDGVTPTVAPVVLSVIVAVSAFVLAHVRLTGLPGVTQYESEINWSMLNGCLTVTEVVPVALPPRPVAVIV